MFCPLVQSNIIWTCDDVQYTWVELFQTIFIVLNIFDLFLLDKFSNFLSKLSSGQQIILL